MFGSTWSNQNQSQQQQQQQPTNTFGQPAGFGSTANNAFGTTNTFGQPQQQQQPQVNPMFGNLGAPAPTTNAGFGAFGGGTTGAAPSAFGAKPATGFGAFGGGTSTFGSTGATSAFGQPAAQPQQQTTSVFGQPATTTPASAFGASSSLFGGNKPAFGTAPGTTGSKSPVITTGTASPPYTATSEKEVPNSNATSQFQAIVSMEAYAGYSFEELRVQDYAQNRKTAATSGFGVTGAFGAPAQPATTSVFGAQPTQPTTTSIFGTPAPAAPSTTGGAFGAFGQTQAQPAANTGSIFGTGSAFGQQNQQPAAAFGAFGQPQQAQQQQQPQQSSIFGTTQSAFGNNTANKPATTGFGGFGTGTSNTNTFGTGGAFGGTQQPQPQPAQTTSLFGNAQAANTSSAFSGFGNTANKTSIFGSQPAAQPAAPAFGAFGNTQQQTQPAQQTQQPSLFGGSSIFGNTQQQQQQQNPAQGTTSLFGQANANTTTPSLFGNTNTTGSLFGNNQQNQQQQQQQQQQQPAAGGGIFGSIFNKPAQPTTSLFGQANANVNNTQTPQPNNLFTSAMGNQGSSLFGNKTAAPALGTSLSGNSGLFGNSTAAAGGQGSLVTSISQPISENVPLYSLLNSAPRILDLDQNQGGKKKAGFFVDIPTRSPVPRVQMGYTPANSKLRGFGSSTNLMSSTGSPFNASISFTSGKPNALVPNKSDVRSSSIGPDFLGRSGSPSLGSGTRQSVKKVILDKKVDPTELFVKSGSPGGIRSGKVTFSPALSVASREKDAIPAAPQVQESPTPAQRIRTPNKFTAQSTKDLSSIDSEKAQSTELTEGDYYLKPDLPSLKKAGYDQLSSFEGLIVGRKGYGEIHFLEPVDLTGLPKLGALLGEVVRFDDKECSVYPDSEDVDKPPPGSGLNVKARLILEHCWAVDKASREPIKDASHPHAVKHLKRLKNMKDTHFENFNIKTGTWTFTVDHF